VARKATPSKAAFVLARVQTAEHVPGAVLRKPELCAISVAKNLIKDIFNLIEKGFTT
jgi:hypothetical protein